jgi:hypothetical protein
LKNTVDVGLTVELDVVTSLMNINAVVLDTETTGASFTHTETLGGDTIIDAGDECCSSSRVKGGHSKVIDLATDKNIFAINKTTIKVAFVGGVAKVKFINQDASDHTFPKATSFRMALKSAKDGNNVSATIQGLVEALEVP